MGTDSGTNLKSRVIKPRILAYIAVAANVILIVALGALYLKLMRLDEVHRRDLVGVAMLVEKLLQHRAHNDHWPLPGVISDSTPYGFEETRAELGGRVDRYRVYSGQVVEVHLEDDGHLWLSVPK